jgi:hypothetical protein
VPALVQDVGRDGKDLIGSPPAHEFVIFNVDQVHKEKRDVDGGINQQQPALVGGGPEDLLPGQQRQNHKRQVYQYQGREVETQAVQKSQQHLQEGRPGKQGQVKKIKSQPQAQVKQKKQTQPFSQHCIRKIKHTPGRLPLIEMVRNR